MLTPKQDSAKRKKYSVKRKVFCLLNFGFWTMMKMTMATSKRTMVMARIIREKSPTDGVRNCAISNIEILLWKKYIVKISRRKSRKRMLMRTLLMIFMNVFLMIILMKTSPRMMRQIRKSLMKYHK